MVQRPGAAYQPSSDLLGRETLKLFSASESVGVSISICKAAKAPIRDALRHIACHCLCWHFEGEQRRNRQKSLILSKVAYIGTSRSIVKRLRGIYGKIIAGITKIAHSTPLLSFGLPMSLSLSLLPITGFAAQPIRNSTSIDLTQTFSGF